MPRLQIIISHLWFVSLHQPVTKNQKTKKPNSFVLIFVVVAIEKEKETNKFGTPTPWLTRIHFMQISLT